MRHSASRRGLEDHRGDTGRAFVGRRAMNAPGVDQRPPGGVGAACRDLYRTGMRSARQKRSNRDDPLDPTAFGHVEERPRIGPPLLMWLGPTEQEQALAAFPGMPREEFAARPVDVTIPISPQPHFG